jgi:hypothetical protein
MTVIKGHWSGDPCCNGLSTSNKPDLITSASVENFMKKSQKFIIYKKKLFCGHNKWKQIYVLHQ